MRPDQLVFQTWDPQDTRRASDSVPEASSAAAVPRRRLASRALLSFYGAARLAVGLAQPDVGRKGGAG